jgi:TatD DNase family protein
MVCNGTHPDDWLDVATLAERFPEILPCFGVHPWHIDKAGEAWESELRDFLARHPGAIGECGLDRWIEPRDESLQETIFRRQLVIAHELQLPIMIHCLRAWGWMLDVLNSQPLPPAMLIHSFGGSAELIAPLSAMNAYFSFSGNIHEPKRQRLRDALLAVPRDRLLLETDAPAMLPPEPWRTHTVTDAKGQMLNHPANLPRVYEAAAGLLGVNSADLATQLEANARRFLGALLP